MSVFTETLRVLSGEGFELKKSEQILFDKVIGFRGIVEGVGCSTILQNVAIALSSRTNMNICVLDTNFLYGMQYDLLRAECHGKDLLDYVDNISVVTTQSKYSKVFVVGMKNRNVTDVLSDKDSSTLITELITALKNYFDVVLVDLSLEPTRVMAESAIKCNKIYTVVDPSLKCVSNIRKSMSNITTLAVPFYKCRKTIINKNIKDVNSGLYSVLEKYNLEVIGDIPLSYDIAANGVTGKKIWGKISNNADVTIFNHVIDNILKDILHSASEQDKLITDEDKNASYDGDEPSLIAPSVTESEKVEDTQEKA